MTTALRLSLALVAAALLAALAFMAVAPNQANAHRNGCRTEDSRLGQCSGISP